MRKDYNLEKRKLVIGGFVVAIVLIYMARLIQLQVLDSTYKANADSNAFMEKVIYPSRGLIYDRNDSLVVYNVPEYDLVMIPKDVTPFDTIDFCNTLQISREEFDHRWQEMRKGRSYSAFTQQVFLQESRYLRIAVELVLALAQAVAFVRITEIFDGHAALFETGHDLIRLADGNARVVGAVDDHERRFDLIHMEDRGDAAQGLAVMGERAVF